MVQLYQSGFISARPNTHCYTAVINSCGFCENDAVEKRDALRVAIETYKELLHLTYDRPNEVTFATMITVLRNLCPKGKDRTLAIGTVFQTCADQGLVDFNVLLRLKSAIQEESELHALVNPQVFLPNGSIDMSQVPLKWRKNVATKKKYSGYQQIDEAATPLVVS